MFYTRGVTILVKYSEKIDKIIDMISADRERLASIETKLNVICESNTIMRSDMVKLSDSIAILKNHVNDELALFKTQMMDLEGCINVKDTEWSILKKAIVILGSALVGGAVTIGAHVILDALGI